MLYEVLGASVEFTGEELCLMSSEAWKVVGFCEVVLKSVLASMGLTVMPDFVVGLVRLVEGIQLVFLLGAEVKRFPSDIFSELLDVGSSAERSFLAIGWFPWLLRSFSEAGGIS